MIVNRQKSQNDPLCDLTFKAKVRNRMVFSFNNKTELIKILGIIEHCKCSKLFQLIQQQRENSDGSVIDEI